MILRSMPFSDYVALPGYSRSALALIEHTPAHWRYRLEHPEPETPAMRFGTAVHAAVLEPEAFAAAYGLVPECDRRTKDGKAAWAAWQADNPGRIPLTPDEWATLDGIRTSLHAHPSARAALFGQGENEVVFTWDDAETGLPCKARVDRYMPDKALLVDLKTTNDASMRGFTSTVSKFRYHMQAAFYTDGAARNNDWQSFRFVFVAVEKEPPYAVACYILSNESVLAGRLAYRAALAVAKQCEDTGEWPGYPPDIQTIAVTY